MRELWFINQGTGEVAEGVFALIKQSVGNFFWFIGRVGFKEVFACSFWWKPER